MVTKCSLPLRAAAEPCPFATGDDLDGDLAGRLVDHLVAEHHRAPAVLLGSGPVGVEDVPGPVELLLTGREHLVENRHLVGVKSPLAVVAEDLRPSGELAEPFRIAHPNIGSVADM